MNYFVQKVTANGREVVGARALETGEVLISVKCHSACREGAEEMKLDPTSARLFAQCVIAAADGAERAEEKNRN